MTNPAAPGTSGFSRWLPAAISGVLLLGCIAWTGLQTAAWLKLRREGNGLRATIPNLETLEAENIVLKKRQAASVESTRAAQDYEELLRLRAEITNLTSRAQEVAALQAEHKRLQAEMAAAIAKAGLQTEVDPFAESKEKAQRINCVSNLKQIGLALRMWSNDNKDVFPMNFLSASNEMNSPKILTCSGDSARQRANNWQEFNPASVSYEFLNPGGSDSDPSIFSIVLTRCPIHNNVGLSDGSVQQLSPQQRVERIDGKWRIVRNP